MSENELSESNYCPPSAADIPTGGLATGGFFGQDGLTEYTHPTTKIFAYASKINPNLLIAGAIAIGGLFTISSVINSLGKANPNNAMLETQRIQAETNEQIVTATVDSLKAVVQQRPSCIAIVCNVPEQAATTTQPSQQPPDLYQPVPATISFQQQTAAIPTDGTTVEYWDYYEQRDHQLITQWITHCRISNWSSQECTALSTALNNGV